MPEYRWSPWRTLINLQGQNSHSTNTPCPERGNCYELLLIAWFYQFWSLSRREGLWRGKRSGLLSPVLWKMSGTNEHAARAWWYTSSMCSFPGKLQKCHPVKPALPPVPPPTCLCSSYVAITSEPNPSSRPNSGVRVLLSAFSNDLSPQEPSSPGPDFWYYESH